MSGLGAILFLCHYMSLVCGGAPAPSAAVVPMPLLPLL